MLKKIVLSFTAVIFLLGVGTSFAANLNSLYLINGETTKATVLSLFGEPIQIEKNMSGKDKYIFEDRIGSRLEVTFDNDVVWDKREATPN